MLLRVSCKTCASRKFKHHPHIHHYNCAEVPLQQSSAGELKLLLYYQAGGLEHVDIPSGTVPETIRSPCISQPNVWNIGLSVSGEFGESKS